MNEVKISTQNFIVKNYSNKNAIVMEGCIICFNKRLGALRHTDCPHCNKIVCHHTYCCVTGYTHIIDANLRCRACGNY